MAQSVVLRHDLPDGSHHFDWLLEPTPGAAFLIAFRVGVDPSRALLGAPEPALAGFDGERLPDHRRLYLDYEGDLSGGRGRVARVARGGLEWTERGQDAIRGVAEFGGTPIEFQGAPVPGSAPGDTPARWRFRLVPARAGPPAW